MKKLFILPCILFSLFVTTAVAQGTNTNTPKNTLAANQNHPALSSPAAKPPVAKKEARKVHINSPSFKKS
jgi:hypothetical protein